MSIQIDQTATIAALQPVATRTALAAITGPTNGMARTLTEAGREGIFVFRTTNFYTLFGSVSLATVDPNQAIYVPPSASPTGSGGAWVRTGRTLTPAMAGATPYNPDAEVDTTTALQAFFNLAKYQQIAREHVFDWSGSWGVTNTIYAIYYDGSDSPYVERRFVMGTLKVLSSVSTSSPLSSVLYIAGPRMSWTGKCGIHHWGTVDETSGLPWYLRRYKTGVLLKYVSFCTFGDFHVDEAKDWGVYIDTHESSGFTANGVTEPVANSIGVKIGMISTRNCGSCNSQLEAAWYGGTPIVANVAGSNNGSTGYYVPGENFNTTSPGGAARTGIERSLITVADATPVEIEDWVLTRLELKPAVYGTVAVVDVPGPPHTSNIVWTAGDPMNLDGAGGGLRVGDKYPTFQSGPNAGYQPIITGFSGTSNRTISVDTVLTAHAATSDPNYWQASWWSYAQVTDVKNSTQFTVYPWIPYMHNSNIYLVHGGALKTKGTDNANTSIGTVEAFGAGIGYYSSALYAAQINTFLGEVCDIGIVLGYPGGLNTGNVINHGHLEANLWDVISNGLETGDINFSSNLTIWKMGTQAPRNDWQTEGRYYYNGGGLGLGFHTGGNDYERNAYAVPYEGSLYDANFYGLTNDLDTRDVFVHDDNPGTIPIDFNDDVARLFPKHHWGNIHWTSGNAAPPTGTLTLQLSDKMRANGWTFDGGGNSFAITNPGHNVLIKVYFMALSYIRKVAITVFHDYSVGDATFGGNVNVPSGKGYKVNGTTAIDSSRNGSFVAVTGTGAITSSSSSAGIGYATGAGGSVTQITSRTTGVTQNTICGKVILVSAAGSTSWQTFTLTNSRVAATDVVRVVQASGTDKYMIHVTKVQAGSFDITFATTGGTTTEQPVFNFAVIKSVVS